MVLMFNGRVNAARAPAKQAAESLKCHALCSRCGFRRALRELEGSPLGLAGVAEYLAIHPVEAMGCCKKAKTAGIANHDAGRL